ncbi:response regulator [Pedobacter gandavensis]|uniref:response regulator n=1 Tax=Pedobacter gandavensis TaxID=2679963 RepID=UPI0024784D1F|nr:response regulator [Pedobacter gandavensis]WGQ09838.1 response regulator [Pedobacter gandavensis]
MKMYRILIIESESASRASMATLLKMANYDVKEAANGKQGVEQVLAFLPDLILCNTTLSDIDGYMTFLLIKQQIQIPLFIFLTSKNDPKEIRKGMTLGADDYLIQPFEDIDILQTIEMRLKKATEQKKQQDPIVHLENTQNGIEAFNKIVTESRLRRFKKSQVLYYEEDLADSLYLIAEGAVKTIKTTADGRELVTGIYRENQYFGINSYFSAEAYHETAETIEETLIYIFPRKILDPLINRFSDLSKKFIEIIAMNNLRNEDQLIEFAYFSVRKRMSQLLLRLYPKKINCHKEWIDISRENLAAMSGMATETVSRVLSDFKKDGLIMRDSNKIMIIDPLRLAALKN